MWTTQKRPLNPAMLVTECNFEMDHFFSRTLKAKMARLNNAGMDRPDGYLMNFASFNAEKCVHCRGIALCSPDGFEPRMALWRDAVLLKKLALKKMGLWM
jgi:hypothetical protein